MKPVFLISNKPYTGRNVLALAIGMNLKEKGLSVAYTKILGKVPVKHEDVIVDEEALFIHKMLECDEPVEWCSPVVLTYELEYRLFERDDVNLRGKVIEVIENLKSKKDVLLVVGGDNLFEGFAFGIDSLSLVKELDVKALVVQSWESQTSVDDILGIKALIGDKFVGAVLNKVPAEEYMHIKEEVVPYLQSKGIQVFGVFKKDKLLEAVTIRRLVEVVGGAIVCCEHKLDDYVENISVGAMDPDNALKYFLKIPNKVVITGVHRTDIQLMALETSTKCLILTGGLHPSELVVNLAKAKCVPIIVTVLDTFSVAEKIQNLMGKTIIKEEFKVKRAKEVIGEKFEMEKFLKAISD
ncbi:MAG: phosphotransacetylase family protein [Thermodesulfobacteria bacterium]|nr:phosphotransacetylase family protein [Thermodesulfobacteriota bacterium]